MLAGKTILITGATNGIGQVAALELARQNAKVVIASRSAAKCEQTVQNIKSAVPNAQVEYIAGDLSTLSGIRQIATQFLSTHQRLDVLLNNAGGYFNTRQETADGLEMTFALNHMSYFLLTHLLLDTLKATAAEAGEARIINVSSSAHKVPALTIDDLQRKKAFRGFRVYGESKLMNVLFTQELAERLKSSAVTVNALHPGFVRTGFGRNNAGIVATLLSVLQVFALTPEKGAETSIYLASSPDVKGVSGQYFVKKKAEAPGKAAQDLNVQHQLWDISAKIAGMSA